MIDCSVVYVRIFLFIVFKSTLRRRWKRPLTLQLYKSKNTDVNNTGKDVDTGKVGAIANVGDKMNSL
jgi:hypothetical protein